MNKITDARFKLHMSPDGIPWKKAKVYKNLPGRPSKNGRRKRKYDMKPALLRSKVRTLRKRMTQAKGGSGKISRVVANGKGFEWGTGMTTAIKLHHGFENVAARPLVGLNGADMYNIVKILADRVEKEFAKGGF